MSQESSDSKVNFLSDGNFAIHVTDIEKAENFYGNVLGFKLIEKKEKQLIYNTGSFTLYINSDNKVIPFIPALEVKDYNEAKDYLEKNGVRIVTEHQGGNALYFKDPFGIIIDIIEKK